MYSDHSLAPSDSVSIMAKNRNSAQDIKDLHESGPSNAPPSSSQSRSFPKSALSSTIKKNKKGKGKRAHFEFGTDGSTSDSNLDDSGKYPRVVFRRSTPSRRSAGRRPSTKSVDPLEDYPGYGRGAAPSQASPFSPASPSFLVRRQMLMRSCRIRIKSIILHLLAKERSYLNLLVCFQEKKQRHLLRRQKFRKRVGLRLANKLASLRGLQIV
jgi:hypothetical protein